MDKCIIEDAVDDKIDVAEVAIEEGEYERDPVGGVVERVLESKKGDRIRGIIAFLMHRMIFIIVNY